MKFNNTRKKFFLEKIKQTNVPPPVLPELSLLYATFHLVLFYIYTKYHQNIPKGICVAEQRQVIQTQEGEI